MDWNVISAISDALAAIAVVVSLLYLAKQLREGRNEQQVENVYAATEGMNTIFLSICENEDLSRIFHAGLADPSSLTRDERHRFMTLFNVIVGRDSTPEKTLSGIRKLVKGALSDMIKSGESTPEPIALKNYSGKFMVRVSPETHRMLAVKAAESGVSLNRLISSKLS